MHHSKAMMCGRCGEILDRKADECRNLPECFEHDGGHFYCMDIGEKLKERGGVNNRIRKEVERLINKATSGDVLVTNLVNYINQQKETE